MPPTLLGGILGGEGNIPNKLLTKGGVICQQLARRVKGVCPVQQQVGEEVLPWFR